MTEDFKIGEKVHILSIMGKPDTSSYSQEKGSVVYGEGVVEGTKQRGKSVFYEVILTFLPKEIKDKKVGEIVECAGILLKK